MKITSKDQLIVGQTILVDHFGEHLVTGKYTNSNNVVFIQVGDITEIFEVVEDSYTIKDEEVKQDKWPLSSSRYWFVDCEGDICDNGWANDTIDKARLNFGNCFRTKKEAESARDKIKELLNEKK